MKATIICLSLLVAIGCRLDEGGDTSETDFVAIAQQQYGSITKFAKFLIKKVHQSNITIDYGFSDNNYCGKQFTDSYEQQIKDSISQSLRVWLAPLANRGEIVNTFKYRYKKTHKARLLFDRKFKYPLFGLTGKPDMSIILYCKQGRSFAWVTSHAMIHFYQKHEYYVGKNGVSDLRKYSIATLHHEIGHAFGLGDTYVDRNVGKSWLSKKTKTIQHHNISDGGSAGTVGNQPISVMNQYYLIAIDSSGKLQLGEDDIAGINWLYDYHVTKTIDSRDCPNGYQYERSTRGCVPKYPFIFAVKQNNLALAKQMLLDDQTININKKDELGNTALHYAATAQKMHGGMLYHYLINKGADTNIKNNNGETPLDLAGTKKTNKDFTNTLLAVLKRQIASPALLELISISLQKKDGIENTKKILSKTNINTHSNDSSGKTLLHQAVIKNKVSIVEFLLTHANPDVNIQSKLSKETALHYAARYGHLEIANLLLAQTGIDIELKDSWKRTPLNRAMQEGQVEVRSAIIAFINNHHPTQIPSTETDPPNQNSNQPEGSGN